MNALGTHLLVELRDCDRKALDNLPFIQETFLRAARETGAHVLGHTFHQFSPQGVTGIVAIAESHLSIHTWPEFGYAAVDVFTCGKSFEPRKAVAIIIQELQSKDPEVMEIVRGRLPAYAGIARSP